jgi:hypothetical protein
MMMVHAFFSVRRFTQPDTIDALCPLERFTPTVWLTFPLFLRGGGSGVVSLAPVVIIVMVRDIGGVDGFIVSAARDPFALLNVVVIACFLLQEKSLW